MGYSSDNFPTGSVLSREFREFLRGMAADVTTLLKYKPVLDAMYMDIVGGGASGGQAARFFPAKVSAALEENGVYFIEELEVAHKMDLKQGGVQDLAMNIWELPQSPGFIVPGAGCIDQIWPENSQLEITIEKIQPPTCVLAFTAPNTNIKFPGDIQGYRYFFVCPTPLCLQCGPEGSAPGSDGGQQQQRQRTHNDREPRLKRRMLGTIKNVVYNKVLGRTKANTNNRDSMY